MVANSFFHLTGAELRSSAPVPVFIPKGAPKGKAANPSPPLARTARLSGKCGPLHLSAEPQIHNDSAILTQVCQRVFRAAGESRFHLRVASNSYMALSMSRLPFAPSDILNSLSELLTELARCYPRVVLKCERCKALLIKGLYQINPVCRIAF